MKKVNLDAMTHINIIFTQVTREFNNFKINSASNNK